MSEIFESPDGGKTVYSRLPHSTERTEIVSDPFNGYLLKMKHWSNILQAAETDPTLKDLLEKVEMVYALTKKEI